MGKDKDKTKQVSKTITDYLEKVDWKYHFDEERNIIFTGLKMNNFLGSLRIVIFIKDTLAISYGILPTNVKKHVKQVVEFLCRANYGLPHGNFEYDYNDGEIRFKIEMTHQAILTDESNIARLIFEPGSTIDTYANGIVQVMTGVKKAKKAIEMCEESASTQANDE